MLSVGGNLFLSGLGHHSQKEFWNLPALLSLDTSIPIENPEGRCPRRWPGSIREWRQCSEGAWNSDSETHQSVGPRVPS